jgi:hypothetical protein
MEQYHLNGVILISLIEGLRNKRINRMTAKEKKEKWSEDERDTVMLVGVTPTDDDEELEETGSKSSWETHNRSKPEYWISQIDVII